MKQENKQIYIAYGSNMNLEQMKFRCPGAQVIGKAMMEGWKLTFQGRPGNAHANIVRDPDGTTPVLVWAISSIHEASLDIYEGVRGGYYRKEYIPVTVDGVHYGKGLVYIMNPNPFNLPSSNYFNGIVQGYRDFGIERTPLIEALKYSDSHMGKEVV